MSEQTVVPESSDLYSLLDEGFNGWGTRSYFDWKYEQYPAYDPAEDNFVIRRDGSVVAARRVFRKRLVGPDGETVPVHVHGGAVVHEDYRGEGHYSTLLEESLADSEDAAHVFTFNRAGKITTVHHQKNDWHWLTLPVCLKPLSPAGLAAGYVFENGPLSDLAGALAGLDRYVTRSKAMSAALARVGGRYYAGHCDPIRAGDPTKRPDVDVLAGESVPDRTIAAMAEVLESVDSDYHFERSERIVRHCTRYPGARTVLARRDGDLTGFAVAGLLRKDDVREVRILEQWWPDPGVRRAILDRIEQEARSLGADALVVSSDRSPGSDWVRLDTEFMMWDPERSDAALPTAGRDWRVTAYDIV